jgi:hypothetical protein
MSRIFYQPIFFLALRQSRIADFMIITEMKKPAMLNIIRKTFVKSSLMPYISRALIGGMLKLILQCGMSNDII